MFGVLFIIITTTIFLSAFHQRIRDFFQANVLWKLLPFGLLTTAQSNRVRGNPVGEEAAPLIPSSSSAGSSGSEFDVFLSFSGGDTRKGFTSHLYEGLELRGVKTFIDSKNLEQGEEIEMLFGYIERSKICVPIFSKGYADSKWCLKELTKIIECRKEIVPVFFGVEPSDVRYQSGPFASAFKKHESSRKLNQEEVRKWREALKKVGNISGFNLKDTDGHEASLKLAIIKRVLSIVNNNPLEVAKHPVGIQNRVQDVKKILDNGGNDVHVVGILGMGGLGKTTIAKAVYNDLLEDFGGSNCFVSDIREISAQPNGLTILQKQFFHDILKDEKISLSGTAQGISLIKDRTKHKKVLLVLDDVDCREQVDALAGGRDWFGSGSVIIITTRDERVLLSCNVKVNEIYKPQELNESQSLELFMHHAFMGEQPKTEYLELSSQVVAATGGLPLALEVFGSLLFCERSVQEWKNTLEMLKKIPPDKVQQRLKISYDGLKELEKKIFLDISCFFIGKDRENATHMWKDRRWLPESAIRVLVQRSLIKIDVKDREFQMHDQIRDMGRAIVQEESSWIPKKQSRLWNYQDTLDLLQNKAPGSIDAEGIRIRPNEERFYGKCMRAQSLEEMHNLRFLHAEHVNFQGGAQHFPTNLTWLELKSCHFNPPPSDFNLEKIVILDICRSNMAELLVNQLQLRGMVFDKLKVLVLSGIGAKITPDFTNMPRLEKLTLSHCSVLTEVHESIGELKSLVYLNIEECEILKILPDSICQLSSLEVFLLGMCSTLCTLPERLGDLQSLKEVLINQTSIQNIPESIGELTNLCKLSVTNCESLKVLPNSICRLIFLEGLYLNSCHSLSTLPERLGEMRSLKELDFSDTSIVNIPDSVGQLASLRQLLMQSCRCLSMLPDPICRLSSLEIVTMWGCFELSSLPERLGDMGSLKELCFNLDSTNTTRIPDSVGQLKNLKKLSIVSHHLKELPTSICQLNSLEDLYLQCTYGLSSLPAQFGEMESLRLLELDRTCIETLPDSVGQLTNLQILILSGSDHLKVLPDSICQLSSLVYLDLGRCSNLSFLPERLGDMKSLCGLILDHTDIETLPNSLGQLKSLHTLSLLGCGLLKTLPDSICQLSSLNYLQLGQCSNLSSLPERLGDVKLLEELFLDRSRIRTLPDSVGRLENLHLLSLEGCKLLKVLPDSICQLSSLRSLRLYACPKLSSLPERLGDMKSLEQLILYYTGIKTLPDSVRRLKNLNVLSCWAANS